MLRSAWSTVIALLLMASATQAGLVPSTERRVNPGSSAAPYNNFAANAFTADTAYNSGTLSNTWVSYALGLTPTDGTKIFAFEVTLTAVLGPNLGFNQRYNFDFDLDTYVATPAGPSVTNSDSHLIIGDSQVFVAPNENKFDAGGPPTAADTAAFDYGVGTTLNGLWSFNGAQQAAQVDGVPARFAYIVIPRGSESNMVITVQAATAPPGGIPYTFTNQDFFVPEPATLSLLGLAFAGFIRRR